MKMVLGASTSVVTGPAFGGGVGRRAEAKPALPAVVRNAERLGLFKGLCLSDGAGKRRAAARGVIEALEHIAREAGAPSRHNS